MRAWIIVLSSAVLALAAAAMMIHTLFNGLPREAILPGLVPLSPAIAVVVLAVYALCALLLMSGDLTADALRVRYHLARDQTHGSEPGPDWMAAFARSALQRLAPPSTAIDGTVLQTQFQPHRARREVARLWYIGAARVHFFSALFVLAAAVILGAAQAHGPLPLVPGPVPTIPAAIAVAGLALLAILSRIAVDVAAEPLIEALSRLPVTRDDTELLHRAVERFAAAPAASGPSTAATTVSVQIPERIGAALEQVHRVLIEAIEQLSATADGLGLTTRSSFEAIERLSATADGVAQTTQSSVEAIERLSATTDGLAQTTQSSVEAIERLAATADGLAQTTRSSIDALEAAIGREAAPAQAGAVDTAAIGELRDAIIALSALLQRASSASTSAPGQPATATPGRTPDPDLALELHKLLQEVQSAR
jgi:hypothetical protein